MRQTVGETSGETDLGVWAAWLGLLTRQAVRLLISPIRPKEQAGGSLAATG